LLVRTTLTVYILCFSRAVLSHGRDFLRHYQATHGWHPYQWGVLPLEAFWTSLIFLDLAVIGMLAAGWRRAGLITALTIMALDVGANSCALFVLRIPAFTADLVSQTGSSALFLGRLHSFGHTVPTHPANEARFQRLAVKGVARF
jgi:hypothetical protein